MNEEGTLPGTSEGRRKRDLTGVELDGLYRLKAQYSKGGMGEIWSAQTLSLGSERFIKLLPASFAHDQEYIDALLREAKLTDNLEGDYFPTIEHCGISAEGIAYYAMRPIPGKDLARLLEEEYSQGMPALEALPLLLGILKAVSVLHAQGVIHRDIKPANIFIESRPGDSRNVRILDFGVAKALNDTVATLGQTLPRGTQQYMAPEQYKAIPDPVTPANDVYAIGLVVYEMILGRQPIPLDDYRARIESGKELSLLHEHPTGKLAGVNQALAEQVKRAVRFDPKERFKDAGEMLESLEQAMRFDPSNLSAGTVLANTYRVIEPLAAGGMGAVYRVEDVHRSIREPQLLKILVYPDGPRGRFADKLRQRFRLECEALHSLQHPSIPHIYANAAHGEYPFLVMAEATGQTFNHAFHDLLEGGGWTAIFKVAMQAASALDAAHELKLIHRDVKPPNIILDAENEKATVLDFGIVRMKDSYLTAEGTRIGTPGFSAPEQIAGETVPASDQWSFAACFYFMLTALRPGARPGEESNPNRRELANTIDYRILEDEVTPLRKLKHHVKVPESVLSAITRALSHEPAARFSSVAEFVRAMEAGTAHVTPPVFSTDPTEMALRKWVQSCDADMETPLLLASSSVPLNSAAFPTAETPLALTPETLETVLPTPQAALHVEKTEEIPRRSTLGASYIAAGVVAILAIALVFILRSRGEGEPTQQQAHLAVTASPEPALQLEEALDDVEEVEAPQPLVTEVPARVIATHNGVAIEGLEVRVDKQSSVTPSIFNLSVGTSPVTVLAEEFAGTYECSVSAELPVCHIVLAAKPVKEPQPSKAAKRGKRRNRKIPEYEGSLIRRYDDKPTGEKRKYFQDNTN
tara:strand:- start:6724 stop:9324 length:2601 start_codon:yes stop_codon:yes gene_type:complete